MSVKNFIVANVTYNGKPSNYGTLCRVCAIAALLQGWLLYGRFCVAGKYVNPSDVLFELVNLDDIHAAITVFEKNITSFKAGMKGVVFLADQPSVKYNVEVILVAKNIDDSRSGLVHCHFENPQHALLPGMFLTGLFEISDKAAEAIPEEAVVRYEGKEYIFITKNGTTLTCSRLKPVQKKTVMWN